MKFRFIKKDEAEPIAIAYCEEKGYSIESLKRLDYFGHSSNLGLFGIKSKVIPDGLMNDLATQPTPILGVILDDSGSDFRVEETEYTKDYFNEK